MNLSLESKPLLIVLSSISGGGKSSLARALIAHDPKLSLSISATTRQPRVGEAEGVDYYFLSTEKFEHYLHENKFLEITKRYDFHYGTLIHSVDAKLNMGQDILFDIDWHGAAAIKKKYLDQVVSVFIIPPSLEVLKERLALRDAHSKVSSLERMKFIKDEIIHSRGYDYIIINDDFQKSLSSLLAIIVAERAKRSRIINLNDFLNMF